jgi:hypothetical protein
VKNFLTEAQKLVSLAHPHIVRVLDFDVENGVPFLVMEYAPHGSLRQSYPVGTRIPPETIVSYMRQVSDALQYAHLASHRLQGDRKGRPYSVRRRREGDESSEPLYVLFPDFTSLVGRKRSADQVSSMAIWVTGRMPAAMRASQPISRVISVFMLELFFG